MKILITGDLRICRQHAGASDLCERASRLADFRVRQLHPPRQRNEPRRHSSSCGVKLFHGDIRIASDLEALPAVDWVIDAAANPSVLAGVDGQTSSRQLVEHNLWRHGQHAGILQARTARV